MYLPSNGRTRVLAGAFIYPLLHLVTFTDTVLGCTEGEVGSWRRQTRSVSPRAFIVVVSLSEGGEGA